MSQLFEELKRRNVFRVGLAYLAVAWLVLQAADIVLDNIAAPGWLMQALMLFIVIGFPVALIFAWAFELTPDGIKKEEEVDRSASITQKTGHKLNRTIIAVLLAAVGILLADKFLLKEDASEISATEKSVAVLPFVAMSRGEDDEYFADGLTEEILNSLTRVPELLVTARTSAFHFKGKDIPIPEIAATLGVAHVVEGSVRRDGDRLRVTAQLIRAADGFHLWSENYDRSTDDTFGVQADIAEKISDALDVFLDDEQREKMHAAGVRNPEAFVAYQKGIERFAEAHNALGDTGLLEGANRWFETALELEPKLADAYTRHADRFTHILIDSLSDPEMADTDRDAAFRQLEEDLENAIRVAPDDAIRLAATHDLAIISGEWREVPSIFDDLLKNPSCNATSNWIEIASAAYGHASDLLLIGKRKAACDPLLFGPWSRVVQAHVWLGEFEKAIDAGEKALERVQHDRIRQPLIMAYIGAGRIEDAERVVERGIRDDSFQQLARLSILAAQGDLAGAQAQKKLLSDGALDFSLTTSIAAQLGDRETVNHRAAELDALPFGHLGLMLIPDVCFCGAPWDIEVTPNFARMLEDANLPWPPASPINWPLKDW